MAHTGRLHDKTFDLIFLSSSDGLILTDAELKIQRMNAAAAAMLGLTPEDVLGQHPNDCLQKNQDLLNLITRQGEQRFDVRLPRRRLAFGIAETMPSGERVVILHDVTEKRELETRREMLIKTISHDLRNPVAAISGFADLVQKMGDLNEPQRRFVTKIRQTSDKLRDMLTTLIDLAWIEAGMPMAHVPIRLDDAVQKAIDLVRPEAQKHQIRIATSLQKPLPVVMGDPERLHHAIYQLLLNAVIYSHPETTIAIHAWGDDHEIYCSVADKGLGIADDELASIFDRMYRSESVRHISGGGLGLTIARTIVQRHGGDLWATSNLGVGSTFTLVLPAVQL